MINSAFSMGEKIHNHTLPFNLYTPLWEKFKYTKSNIDFVNWTSIKYLDITGTSLNSLVNSVPNNQGGLYLFYVKCKVITGLTEYPLYIGRAQFSTTQNLRKRVKEYFQKFSKDNERPKITKMIKYWGKDLYLAYLPLPTNKNIVTLERELINSLLLPMNDSIPDKKISTAVKAFK